MRNCRFPAWALLLLLSACQKTVAIAAAQPNSNDRQACAPSDGVPNALKDNEKSEEATNLATQRFDDQGISGSIEGTTLELSKNDPSGNLQMALGLGGQSPGNCTLFSSPVPPAVTLMRALEPIRATATLDSVVPRGPFVENERPIYFLLSSYRRTVNGVRTQGLLKVAHLYDARHPVVCTHDAPGYRETFERVTRGLAKSLHDKYASEFSRVEVFALKFGNVPVGFSISTLQLEGPNLLRHNTHSAQAIPRSNTELVVLDETQSELSSAGIVQEIRDTAVDQSGTNRDIRLRAINRDQYEVMGVLDSKAVSATIQAPGGLPTEERTFSRLRAQLDKGGEFDFVEPEFLASLDPTALANVRYFRLKSDPPHVVHSSVGLVDVAINLDTQGRIEREVTEVGPNRFVSERIYERPSRPQQSSLPAPFYSTIEVGTTDALPRDQILLTVSAPNGPLGELTARKLAGNVKDGLLRVTLQAAYPAAATPPLPYTSHCSHVIDCDDSAFSRVDLSALGQKPTRAELVRFTREHISKKQLSRAFDIASAVLVSKVGDCTEHSVLLTALARKFGFASRVVFGLVVLRREGEAPNVVGHAWSEIHDGSRWQLADAAMPDYALAAMASKPHLTYLPMQVLEREDAGFRLALLKSLDTSFVRSAQLHR